MTNYPFLDRIPPDKRLTAMNVLNKFQQKKYDCDLECVAAFRAGNYNPLSTSGETIVNAPQYQEEAEIEAEKEPARNKDIKERME